MSTTFTVNTNPNVNSMPAPIYPDFNPNSDWHKKLIKIKQENGPNYWSEMREIFKHDLATLPKSRFKVWASVMSVPLMSLARHMEYIRVALVSTSNPVYHNALIDSGVGLAQQDKPLLYLFDNYPTTMNRVQALSHILINGWNHENISKLNTIVELGGGVGDMADIFCKLGFKGKYLIYDLPEISEIQKYHMGELGNNNVEFTNNVDDLVEADLVVATWSLTEMPLDTRAAILNKLAKSKNWLLAYSKNIFNIDNEEYIQQVFLPNVNPDDKKSVEFTDIPFMPWDGGTKYLSIKE